MNFETALSKYRKAWNVARERKASHDQLRHLFLQFLNSAFPGVDVWEVDLEQYIKGVGVRGFIDLLYNELVFEFKKDLRTERQTGLIELKKYLGSQKHPEQMFGILTDGGHFEVYVLRGDELLKTEEFNLVSDDFDAVRLSLDTYLFAAAKVAPTSIDIIKRFGMQSPVYIAVTARFEDLYAEVANDSAVQTKFREWDNLLAHVYGSPVGDPELFLRHSYLVLLTRLIAYMALAGKAPDKVDLLGIVDGSAFEPLGIPNLADEDFFAWLGRQSRVSDVQTVLNGIATHLGVYDFAKLDEDVLKELYQNLIDPRTRHDLGEYYTPDWLAELTLREAGFSTGKSLLDPACGSGTFLFTAVRLLREQGLAGKELVQFVFRDFAGVDVHPVAVMTAKVNLLLALLPDLKGKGIGRLPLLPIFMADTLRVPIPRTKKRKATVDGVTVPVDFSEIPDRKPREIPTAFVIPKELAKHPERLDKTIDRLVELASADREIDDDDLLTAFGHFVEAELGKDQLAAWSGNFRLLRWLITRPQPRDTVWGFILRNAYRPVYFSARKFDFIAGNPPWLVHHLIKRVDYKEEVQALAKRYDLLELDQPWHFSQLEIATIFFALAVDQFLATPGTLAFVMTGSVLTGAKQHAKFQQKYEFARILDFAAVEPIFGYPACVLIHKSGPQKSL